MCVSVCFGAFCRSWPVLAFLGRFWSLLVALGAHLGRPWGVLGSLLAALGGLLGVLGLLLAALGALLAALGAILAALGDPWRRSQGDLLTLKRLRYSLMGRSVKGNKNISRHVNKHVNKYVSENVIE